MKAKKYIVFAVLFICVLSGVLYTRPKHIQDNITVAHFDNGECHEIIFDLYEKKSLLRPTVFYGSIWVDDEEYVRSYDNPISFKSIKKKFQELFSSPAELVGNFYNKKIKWPTEEYKWPLDDCLCIADYKNNEYDLRFFLSGEKCIFTTGMYVGPKAMERMIQQGFVPQNADDDDKEKGTQKDQNDTDMKNPNEEMVHKGKVDGFFPEFDPHSSQVYVSGQWLYFCDPARENAFYAYDLETGKDVFICAEEGKPKKTAHGLFYNVSGTIYQVDELNMELLCKIPEGAELVDCWQGEVYWLEGWRALYAGKINPENAWNNSEKPWDAGKILTAADAKKLYCVTEEEPLIFGARILDGRAYIGRLYDGIYCLDFTAMEAECILEGEIFPFLSYSEDEDYILVGAEGEGLYVLSLEDNTLLKRKAQGCEFALVSDGVVYYPDEGGKDTGLLGYDLEQGSSKVLTKESEVINRGYRAATVYKNYLVLRDKIGYDIFLYDLENDTFRCIVSTGDNPT